MEGLGHWLGVHAVEDSERDTFVFIASSVRERHPNAQGLRCKFRCARTWWPRPCTSGAAHLRRGRTEPWALRSWPVDVLPAPAQRWRYSPAQRAPSLADGSLAAACRRTARRTWFKAHDHELAQPLPSECSKTGRSEQQRETKTHLDALVQCGSERTRQKRPDTPRLSRWRSFAFMLGGLTFDVRGTRRRRRCSRSEQSCPAVVCPLDGRVRPGERRHNCGEHHGLRLYCVSQCADATREQRDARAWRH